MRQGISKIFIIFVVVVCSHKKPPSLCIVYCNIWRMYVSAFIIWLQVSVVDRINELNQKRQLKSIKLLDDVKQLLVRVRKKRRKVDFFVFPRLRQIKHYEWRGSLQLSCINPIGERAK